MRIPRALPSRSARRSARPPSRRPPARAWAPPPPSRKSSISRRCAGRQLAGRDDEAGTPGPADAPGQQLPAAQVAGDEDEPLAGLASAARSSASPSPGEAARRRSRGADRRSIWPPRRRHAEWRKIRRAMSRRSASGFSGKASARCASASSPVAPTEPVAEAARPRRRPGRAGPSGMRAMSRSQRGDEDGAEAPPDPLAQRHRHRGPSPSPRAAASRSQSSRTAPRPPGARETKWTAARTSG